MNDVVGSDQNIETPDKVVDTLIENAKRALEEFLLMDQQQVDKVVHSMTLAGVSEHFRLAKMAVEETGRGIVEDKVMKNLFSTEFMWDHIKHEKSVGIILENDNDGFYEVAEPVGIVAGVTPVTNPTSTTMFKSIICAKARNPIIFAFHPSAQKCSSEAARILRDAGIKNGAPKNFIQWIEVPSIETTNALMNHPGVSLVLATGGSAMVRAAYSTGKPALGVGPGNTPCYINKDADIERACNDIMLSKTFDNGMICASEQGIIVDQEVSADFERVMKDNNCYFLSKDEVSKLSDYMINIEKRLVNPEVVGMTANFIAEKAGIKVPEGTKILIAKLPRPSLEYPLSLEKLSPVLAYFVCKDEDEGFDFCKKMLELGGLGHTAVIHSNNLELCKEFGKKMLVGRVVCNSPASQGAIGELYNANIPSLTLGCGTFGRNSTSSNVSSVHLINKKKLLKRRNNMQSFIIPDRIVFEEGSVKFLQSLSGISRVIIVTDPMMVKLGYVDKVIYHLHQRQEKCVYEIFSEVEPDPTFDTVNAGVNMMNKFQPDTIIAIGGGSSIDAAKGMWLFYEHPDLSFDNLSLKFLDDDRKSFAYPKLGNKAKLVTIPTTSGTGSEVTCFSVITKKGKENIKYPLADDEIMPNYAIVDPQFVRSLPKGVTADTGMDVLTHAIEAYVSIMASDFTDGLAIKAIELVFKYLPLAYKEPDNSFAREKMHNASTIAGMAFTNAFLGINHSLAHKLGGEYNIPHGRANAVLLPYVIKYNSQKPTKFAAFPKYGKFIADERYAQIAKYIGIVGTSTQDYVEKLIEAIRSLMRELEMPMSISECGIKESTFFSKIDHLSELAFTDQCTGCNPRYPLISELKQIYTDAFYGESK